MYARRAISIFAPLLLTTSAGALAGAAGAAPRAQESGDSAAEAFVARAWEVGIPVDLRRGLAPDRFRELEVEPPRAED